MKRKSFKTFLSDYVKEMNPEQSLSLFKNEKYVSTNRRLLNVYLFYVLFNDNVKQTLLSKEATLPNLFTNFKSYREKYDVTLATLPTYVKHLDEFDELKQLYTSYQNLVVNRDKALKEQYHKRIIEVT